jgi:fibronectin-binding autotransporter adhesin
MLKSNAVAGGFSQKNCSQKSSKRTRAEQNRRLGVLSAAAVASLFAQHRSALAASVTWLGTAANNNWSNTGNWVGGAYAGSTSSTTDTDIAYFNTNATNKAPVFDLTNFNLAGFTFDAGAGAFTVGSTSGPAVLLSSGGATTLTSGDTAAQIVNAPIVIENAAAANAGTYSFADNSTTTGATLTVGGGVTGAATLGNTTTITFGGVRPSGASNDTFSGVIGDGSGGGNVGITVGSGWGYVLLNGPTLGSGLTPTASGANWQFSANDTFTGPVSISSGTARLSGASGRFSGTTALTINGGSTFFDGDATAATNNGISNRVNSASSLTLGGSLGGGTFTMAAPGTTASQTFAALAVGAGGSIINSTATSSTLGSTTLTFTGAVGGAGYTRNTNGIVSLTSGIGTATQTNVTTTLNSNIIGINTSGILLGQVISGTNIPAGAVVQSISDGTHLVITANASASSTTGTATYFISSTNQIVQFTNAPTAAGGSSVSGTSAPILIGATLNGTDFVAASSGAIAAPTYTTNGASSLTADGNINVTGGNTTLAGNSTLSVNSLRFPDSTQRALALGTGSVLTVASGGILIPNGPDGVNDTISGGTITSGQSDLWVYSAAGNTTTRSNGVNGNPRAATYAMTISSVIGNNGGSAVSLTVGGDAYSQVQLSGVNTYTGGTFLENGMVAIGADSGLGASSGTVTAVSGVNSIAPTASFTFNSSRNFVINSGAQLQIGGAVGYTNTIAGQVSGGGELEVGFVSNGERLILTGNNSSFTGRYDVNGYLNASEGMGLSSNANLDLAGRGAFGSAILETSGNFVRSLGSGAGQVQWSSPNAGYSDGGFAAVGGALTVSLGGLATPTTLTQNSGGFLPSNSYLNLQDSNSTGILTWANPINNNGSALNVVQVASSALAGTAANMTGVISGTGGFIKNNGISNGAGLLILSGSNTYTGQTAIQYGTLSVASLNYVSSGSFSGRATGSNLGDPSSTANGLIVIGSAGLSGNLTYTGAGETTDRTIQVGVNSAPPVSTDVGGATLENDGGGALVFTAATFNTATNAATGVGANRSLTLQGSNAGANTIQGIIQNNTISGTATGTATITINKAGTDTWLLSGANTYSGGTNISAGTLQVGNATALGASAGAVSVTSGAVLDLDGTTMTNTNGLTLNGTGIASGGALINSSGTAATYAGQVVLGSTSSIVASGGNIALSATGTITGSGDNLTLGGANNGSIASIIGTGAGTLTVTGGGTWVLSAVNTFTGSTTISTGTLQISGAGQLNTGAYAGTISDFGTLQYSSSANQTLSAAIGGTGALTKDTSSSSTLTVSASNTFSGATTLTLGTLDLQNQNALQNSTLTMNDGTLVFDSAVSGNAFTLGGLSASTSGAGYNIALQNNASPTPAAVALTVGGNNISTTYAGVLSGGGSLTKTGSGTLTLSGSTNAYTGLTTVAAGSLVLTGSNTLGAGSLNPAVIIGNSSTPATLTLSGSGVLSVPGNTSADNTAISIGNAANSQGTLNIQGTSQLNLLTASGGTNNWGGNLTVGNGGSTSAGAVIQSGGAVTVDESLLIGTNGYGYYGLSAGTLTLTAAANNNQTRFRIGVPTTGDNGVFQMTGGTLNVTGTVGLGLGIVDAAGGSVNSTDTQLGYGSFYATGGTFSSSTIPITVAERGGQGDLTVGGTASINLNGNSVNLATEVTNGVGILNLDGGTLQAASVGTVSLAGTSYVNFNGGTLRANGPTATFLTGLNNATVNGAYTSGGISYAGGGTIDTNGQNITIGQNLLAPTGNGVATSGTFTPITGVIGAPYVQVLGTGTGATAQAIFNASTGTVTGITVTNPGNGYTGTPTFNLFGGGLSGTTVVNGTTAANTSGGLTKIGTGTLTLSASNNYSGGTTISAGTLRAANASAFGTGPVDVKATIAVGADSTHPGLLNINNSGQASTWEAGANYAWKTDSSAGTGAGTNFDQINMTSLNVTASHSSPFTIVLSDLTTAGGTVGTAPAGLAAGDSWILATTSATAQINGINVTSGGPLTSGLSSDVFALNTSSFDNSSGQVSPSAFSLDFVTSGGGDNLVLTYNATPEPGTALLVLAGAMPLLNTRRRRRTKTKAPRKV